jgi:hypothetical protein
MDLGWAAGRRKRKCLYGSTRAEVHEHDWLEHSVKSSVRTSTYVSYEHTRVITDSRIGSSAAAGDQTSECPCDAQPQTYIRLIGPFCGLRARGASDGAESGGQMEI